MLDTAPRYPSNLTRSVPPLTAELIIVSGKCRLKKVQKSLLPTNRQNTGQSHFIIIWIGRSMKHCRRAFYIFMPTTISSFPQNLVIIPSWRQQAMASTPEPFTRCKTWNWAGLVKEMIVFTLMEKNILPCGGRVRKIILAMPGAFGSLTGLFTVFRCGKAISRGTAIQPTAGIFQTLSLSRIQ